MQTARCCVAIFVWPPALWPGFDTVVRNAWLFSEEDTGMRMSADAGVQFQSHRTELYPMFSSHAHVCVFFWTKLHVERCMQSATLSCSLQNKVACQGICAVSHLAIVLCRTNLHVTGYVQSATLTLFFAEQTRMSKNICRQSLCVTCPART